MIVHNFDPVFIDLGLFQIRWYSLAYIFGILLGWMYAIKIIKLTDLSFKPLIIEEPMAPDPFTIKIFNY